MWMRLVRRLCLAGCCILGVAAVEAEDPSGWNQWRGAGRDGHAAVFGRIESWPLEPEVLWSVPAGEGQASPVLADDRLVVFERNRGDETVRVLDLDTGAEVWRDAEPVSFHAGMGGGRFGTGPKATPAVASGRVVTFGITGRLAVRDLQSGGLLWRRDPVDEGLDPIPDWGNSVSPLIVDEQVIVQFGRDAIAQAGRDRPGSLRAYDLNDGRELWRAPVGTTYSSPIVFGTSPSASLAMMTVDGPVGLSMDGRVLWTIDSRVAPTKNLPTPVYTAGRLVFSGDGRSLYAYRVAPDADGWTAEPAWTRDDLSLRLASVVVADGRVVGLASQKKGQLFCVDLETGADIWRGPPRTGDHVVVLVVPDYLLALSSEGKLTVLDRTASSYEPRIEYEVSTAPVYAHPAVVAGGLVIKSDEEIQRLRFTSGP